ncbi:elongation factor P maturation arginine rhamnosyltransferase EarP [Pseudomonas sp. CDFA 602]|uniref:elongation factor P maturation arginine rhamnosyltransferase EarP n=1 Tax=Pseudomonas californiensis TaxID=2829823 RepID=UPI001E54E9F0|nr:elongation factor P maturation arginine rhamnosyltransferase EarP [Pseudomonas californiensis]MCD5997082.1 elongation factor P maturation arginine rhamnosyltransferase EarP [Pseudomonas californiensis]MCD6002684.1 elongation factor P maturation arginine rhamnosyltransferase EarP [Pseudomonas californiensis]
MKASWDIFCSVVDNFGDVGVTWRLARQLAAEHDLNVRLWIDDLSAFVRLCPGADPDAVQQWHAGVSVCQWPTPWRPADLPDVVLEAFACRLPDEYTGTMLQRSPRPFWLNLDYLSAEDWVSGCHRLPSVQSSGLKKFFFFPGFQDGTGGLLREAGLIERRQSFQQDKAARQGFLKGLGIEPRADARLMTLFAYENPTVGSWLDALASDTRSTHLLVPEGRILGDLQQWREMRGQDTAPLKSATVQTFGALTIQVMPFVRQEDYDRLLWCCDFNVVRGEDSFVRGQWAGRPMLWHIYQQEEGAHLPKLESFLTLYAAGLSSAAAQALNTFWLGWSAGDDVGEHWRVLNGHWPEIEKHAERWCLQQASRTDLATALVQFYGNSL